MRADAESGAQLESLARGILLGFLPKEVAERGYNLYRERLVQRVSWTGDAIVAELSQGSVHVMTAGPDGGLDSVCSLCGEDAWPCTHAAAALLQWIDIRPTMLRMGPGTMWRARARHPFLAPARPSAERVDLGHLVGADLRSALELQLSLNRRGSASARLSGDRVEISLHLPSGDERVVAFDVASLPSVLPFLQAMPGLHLEEELADLELSEARLHPVLVARWDEDGIVLEPGYGLTDGTVLPAHKLNGRIHGRWVRVSNLLCRRLDPDTPLVPFHRRGRQVLSGRAALRFINLDHPQLSRHQWYIPQGGLARLGRPVSPKACGLEAETDARGRIRLRPRFTVGDHALGWQQALDLQRVGFQRIDGAIVRAPDLAIFERAGFEMPKRGAGGGLRGSRLSFIRLVAETGLPVVRGDRELRRLGAILLGRDQEDVGPPPGLRSTLRPYQQEGVGWLWRRVAAGLGALLADDMGLGKTHQVMGLLCLMRREKPDLRALVVCPRGVLEHWHTLLSLYAPEIDVGLYHGPSRSMERMPTRGLVLTTYDILVRSMDQLTAEAWDLAVFDEAQRIKNPRTKAARAARRLHGGPRVALSGTPLENDLVELWSVIDLILPGYLGPEREFRRRTRAPSPAQLHRLRRRLSVLTLRRVKEQVLDDLPEKVEDTRYCRLSTAQRVLYERIHRERAEEIAEQLADPQAEVPYMHIFALLTRLKQVCDHPALVQRGTRSSPSGKLEVLEELLDEALASGHRVVVFSQYVEMIRLLGEVLDRSGIGHLTLTGETRDRARVIRRFNSEQHEGVLLASLLAGGVGIDLTAASVVIHYDRWWNPAKENQATDRVHRIGQKRFVQVFKLVTRGTIEERIDRLIRSKLELMEEVVPPTEDVIRRLDRSELADLLGLGEG